MPHDNGKFYGFTEDRVFGWVMEDKEFCKFILQTILPDLKIQKIEELRLQEELNSAGLLTKDVRLDVLVTDEQGRVYNIEMQNANEHNLGKRMRYYLSAIDQHNTLRKGATYNELKEAYVIFLCDFDYTGQGRLLSSFHTYDDHDRAYILPTGAHFIIISDKGNRHGQSQDLQNLAKLMNGEKITGNKHFDYAQEKIAAINQDPQRRAQIMLYETRLLEREQYGEAKGRKAGMRAGEAEGRKAGRLEATLADIRKNIAGYRSFGISDEKILERLIADYGSEIDPKQIKAMMEE
ncbi:MAG: Rpn family recombination-promoting nuclease/putative transposase [Lactobacillus sp.]|jgi:predicted transposase/invertase (TIGR01784 family)|nr:Rpn family recombination-promoting nuclease/putative transposase [Lactobacillus sp.]MCI1466189.1 Rpn family recombination-promoting nuclease/putative transposase [Lactobacillus sp.]MCI1481319.1 Rpn family recombination-promoting nuclease/putative transposase [Lactobacillus sp.]MCI1915836.1 Rpn family recombination-promoting nuclease/putative transposase [Lactobacillus sp.]MCI1942676.1 Rpn family recombination-promoting nuclease/putative transposase [Lactobacillus sp.]